MYMFTFYSAPKQCSLTTCRKNFPLFAAFLNDALPGDALTSRFDSTMQLVLRRTLLDTRSAVSLCHFERARCTLVTPLSCPAFVTIRLAFWEMKTENRSDKASDTTHFLFCSICLFIHLSIRLSSYYIYGVNYVCVRMKKSWKSESKTPWPVK